MSKAYYTTRPAPETMRIHLSGSWHLGMDLPAGGGVLDGTRDIQRIEFDAAELDAWDSSLLLFIQRIAGRGRKAAFAMDFSGLPAGVQRLLALADTAPLQKTRGEPPPRSSLLTRLGAAGLQAAENSRDLLGFVGELAVCAIQLVRGKARMRTADFWRVVKACSVDALPIVSLVSLLVGLIMAFVGSIQLALFGAQIYVADLVGIVIAREMGVVMTGVIMSGRTGAAFAAQLGTMQINEEIDALRTLGISPMAHLVLPRVAALVLMMPLLTLYADLMGLLGGLIVGVGVLNISLLQYIDQSKMALTLTHFSVGLVKSLFFGFLVAVTGCMQGMRCGRSASDVGLATTSAVVTAIVGIIVVDGIFAILTDILGI